MNWNIFTSTLQQDFKSFKYQNEREFANKLTNLYDILIKNGLDEHGNNPINTQPNILTVGFYNAFVKARRGIDLKKVSKEIISTIIIYWSTITMGTTVPPPGSVKSINNKIIFPGMTFEFPIYNIMDANIFVKNLEFYFKLHLKNIKGINTALVQVGNTLVPTPFPWTGIK